MGDVPLVEESLSYDPTEQHRLLQACTFIEDAINFRLTYHRVDSRSLKLYRLYHSYAVQWSVNVVIFILHLLIFFEAPSSLSASADVRVCQEESFENCRVVVPTYILLPIEGVCLVLLALDCFVKIYSFGVRQIRYYPWHVAYAAALAASIVGWFIAMLLPCCNVWAQCGRFCKLRCLLRPIFLVQHSPMIKKALKCLVKALPSILSVLLLLFLHILLFTLVGLALYPSGKGPVQIDPAKEEAVYFTTATQALVHMFILITTANNPNIMTAAYNENRLYALFFIIYIVIGIYCFLYILLAVVFQQFRDYFKESLRNRILRRRAGLVSAFQVLSDVDLTTGKRFVPARRISAAIFNLTVVNETKAKLAQRFANELARLQNMEPSPDVEDEQQQQRQKEERDLLDYNISWRQFFKKVFAIGISDRRPAYIQRFSFNIELPQRLSDHVNIQAGPVHRSKFVRFTQTVLAGLRFVLSNIYFIHFGSLVNIVNVIIIIVQTSDDERKVAIETPSYVFICYYLVEQLAILWALGPKIFFRKWLHRLDFFFTILICLGTITYLCTNASAPVDALAVRYATVGITHVLIGCRFVRAVLSLQLPNLIVRTMADLLVNLMPFLGLLMAQYYLFAVLGMILFSDVIKYDPKMKDCWKWDNESDNCRPPILNTSTHCPFGHDFHENEFWAENFNDFASTLVVLWNLMVVNNWPILLEAFTVATNPGAEFFFILWYIMTVLISLDLFIAVIVENFNTRWSAYIEEKQLRERHARTIADVAAGRLPSARQTRVSNRTSNTGSRPFVRTHSQPMPLAYILGVDAPNMELVREHLASNPFNPMDYTECPDDFLTIYDTDSEDERADDQPSNSSTADTAN